jgi:hypothetical protein
VHRHDFKDDGRDSSSDFRLEGEAANQRFAVAGGDLAALADADFQELSRAADRRASAPILVCEGAARSPISAG